MFDLNPNSFDNLDSEERETLVELLETRALIHARQAELMRLRVEAVKSPTPEALQRAETYAQIHLKPLRDALEQQMHKLAGKVVDKEKFQELLPMVLMSLAQAVDIPLLLTILGADPDVVVEALTKVREYFAKGMES